MIDNRYKSLLVNESSSEFLEKWFSKKEKAFIHNVDTFYYSVKLKNDFSCAKDPAVVRFRQFLNPYQKLQFGESSTICLPGVADPLVATKFTFAYYYNVRFSCGDWFDIFVAPEVPSSSQGGESVTSEIIVQIRSYMLWMKGPMECFNESYSVVKKLITPYGLTVKECKENRVDFAWHSNYLRRPEKYFNIEDFSEMAVTRFRGVSYHYSFKHHSLYENDYVALGKRSDKVFVRIYLKTKEVVEQGYKPWFFRIWAERGMISKYDWFCLEYAFVNHSWKKLDLGRLQFYSEYGSDESMVLKCNHILNNEKNFSFDDIGELADLLTPQVTSIMNVEFQTMRKGSKSYNLIPMREYFNPDTARIEEYFDNWSLITDYLTHYTLRLVDTSEVSIKTNAPYNEFWSRLRKCVSQYQPLTSSEEKLTRAYNRKLNKELMKKRMTNSIVSYGFYIKGLNEDSPFKDCSDAICRLNDNDLKNMQRYKSKRSLTLNSEDFNGTIEDLSDARFSLIDLESGEILNDD